MNRDADKLDGLVDEALQDLTAGRPRAGFRDRVLARIAEAPEPAPTRIIELFGWRVRPFQLLAAGAAVGVLTLAVVLAPRLWPARGTAPASSAVAAQRGIPRAPVTPAAGATAAAAKTPQAIVQAGSVASRQPAAWAERRLEPEPPIEAAGDAADVPGPIPPVTIEPLAPPDEITITPIEVEPVTIPDITIPEIRIAPIQGGGLKQ